MSSTRRRIERARLGQEGREAHAAGRRRTQCPYLAGSSDARDWEAGWDMADCERESAIEEASAVSKYDLAERARSATSIGDLAAIIGGLIERLPDDLFADA